MASWFKKKKAEVNPISTISLNKSTLSMNSMTPSQLNFAIMEMLDIRQTDNCETVCRGNPITSGGKRKQVMKMLALVLIPLVILSGMTANSFTKTLYNYFMAENSRSTLSFCTDIGNFLRVLQRERDMSALYMSSIGPETKGFLLRRYPETDEGLQNLSQWPVSNIQPRAEFQSKDQFAYYLNKHRYQLDIGKSNAKDEIAFYTDAIDVFHKWLFQAISESNASTFWKSLVSYQEIILTSEYIGKERAFGVTFFADGRFETRNDFLQFLEYQNVANSTYMSARRYSIGIKNFYEELTSDVILMENIRNMRNQIRSNNSSGPSLQMAEWWFENMTKYQEGIRDSQKRLAVDIDERLIEQSKKELNNIYVVSGIFLGVVLLSPIIIYGVYSRVSQSQNYSISIAKRTKALNREKKRTDDLLYQMLPKAVADQLKQNQQVEAEQFNESTIFFSDIVGFTRISSTSSPFQVVNMLNILYSAFDEKMLEYDVFKVETIGDAYMVVSGVPNRNESRHAKEIVNMALDLLEEIVRMEIPHLPGTTFQLRIGCHSGPVVAGVVGTKMPRYCLFGETVAIASKMESLGKANHVHISESTYDYLANDDDLLIQKNRDPAIQNDIDLQNAFSGIVCTYLVTKCGFDGQLSTSDECK